MKPTKKPSSSAPQYDLLGLGEALDYLDAGLKNSSGVVPPDFHSYTSAFLRLLSVHFCQTKVRFTRLYLNQLVDYVLSNPASADVDSFPAATREYLNRSLDSVDVVSVLDAVHCLVEGNHFYDDLPVYTLEEEASIRFGKQVALNSDKPSPEQQVVALQNDLLYAVSGLQALTQYCLNTNVLNIEPAASRSELATWQFNDSQSRPYLGLAIQDAALVEPAKAPHTVLSVTPWPSVSSVKLDLALPTEKLVQLVSRTFCDVHQTIELKKGS